MKFLRFLILLLLLFDVKSSWAVTKPAKVTTINTWICDGCFVVDDSHVVLNPSDCNIASGSITGIIVTGATGTVTYTWTLPDGTLAGSNADLINVPPDTYTLKVRDQSKCTSVTKKYIVGQVNSSVIDDSHVNIKQAGCAKDGSITNINVQNAGLIQWFDINHTLVGNSVDLKNIPSGFYSLVVTGKNGCSVTSSYQVSSSVYFPGIVKVDTLKGTCNNNAGVLTVTINSKPTDPIFTYFVNNTGGITVATGAVLYNSSAPTLIGIPIDDPNENYTLTFVNADNCQIVVGQFSLPPPVFEITTKNLILLNDACGRHTGAIEGLKVIGGTGKFYGNPPDDPWTWTDSAGTVLGHLPDLSALGKGTYTVTVKDIMGCSDTKRFTITDSTAQALPPAINGATLCLPANVTLSVINPNPKLKYRLYDSTQMPITENGVGMFQQYVTHTTKFYVTTVDALCESTPTPVTVTVVAPGVIIPNTFTPNNDGINDFWNIPHIYDFPGAEIYVYTRDGLQVYHSVNYSSPFNGKLNGKALPVGVYYYTIDLKQPECLGKIAGNLTLIR